MLDYIAADDSTAPRLPCQTEVGGTRCLGLPSQHGACVCPPLHDERGRIRCAEIVGHTYRSPMLPCLTCDAAIHFSGGAWWDSMGHSADAKGSHRPMPTYIP
jgi:hypothetical protein